MRQGTDGAYYIVGTVSGGGWHCIAKGEGIAMPWGKDNEIMDQRWNKVSAHVDWISEIMKGKEKPAFKCKASTPKGKKEDKIAS